MSAFKSIAQRDYANAIEVFATRGIIGSVLDRKLFPSEAVAEALFYARLLSKRFGCEMIDRTAVAHLEPVPAK